MNITYNKAESGDNELFAKIALKHRLFINGWELSKDLKNITESDEIVLAYDSDVPVGIALQSDNNVQCFVRKNYRRCGIGTALVSMINFNDNTWAGVGITESAIFWSKIGVPNVY